MTKRVTAKHKIDRRLGDNLWGRSKSPVNKRQTRPGQHAGKPHKSSEYGLQLKAKQRLRGYYGNLNERQFRNTYEEAVRRRGDTGENLVDLLERRLDAVVYRLKWAPTVFNARQLVNHGHVLVNGKRVNIPSYKIKESDEITLHESMRSNAVVLEAQQSSERDVPGYYQVDDKVFQAKFTRSPTLADIPYPVKMEPHLVIEFYSR